MKNIPILKVDEFLTERIAYDICDFLGKTREDLTILIEGEFNEDKNSLNSKAVAYINFRLGKHISKVDSEKWLILKENYIFWKLYEMANIVQDLPVKDKKKELDELLKTLIDTEATKYQKKGVIVI
ncbi:MAG: hypothetical protein MJH09_06455 [Cetobacterium sp.]|nr:hypothetical protein [Cetobacterium sp.]